MRSGIRATVEFQGEDACPVVERSATEGAVLRRRASSVSAEGGRPSVSEYASDSKIGGDPFDPVFDANGERWYRLRHDGPPTCPCERLGRFECPIATYVADDGVLRVVFHASDYDALREVIADLRDRFPSLDVKRFVRSPPDADSTETVLVNLGKLTDRQRDVLETAREMGYFDRPRGANATEVADALDIAPSTFAEHLAAAQRKLLDDVL
jgi:DNA-binding CsgD family transcriptional regulator